MGPAGVPGQCNVRMKNGTVSVCTHESRGSFKTNPPEPASLSEVGILAALTLLSV